VSVSAVETLIFRARRSLRLRSSAIRVLTGVPLPGSLAQLFEGGAVVAGGGAIVGTGVLSKAMVVLVAGAVATGVGGDKTDRATAAAKPAAPVAQASGSRLMARSLPNSFKDAQLEAAPGRAVVTTAKGTEIEAVSAYGESRGSTSSIPAATATGSSPPPAVAQVVATVSGLVGSAENAATPPPVSLPAQAPSLPAAPVQLPALPSPLRLP
jgi:hypothetical protein